MVARSPYGQGAAYPVVQTVQKDPDAAKSVYAATVRFPKAGKYNVIGVVKQGDQLVPTGTGVKVSVHDPIPTVGEQPPMIDTPTVASVNGDVGSIDTRSPHDDMHDENFRDVIGKKPVVLSLTSNNQSVAWKSGTGTSAEVASMGSRPAIVRSTIAASFTVFASGPMWSSDEANAISP